MARLIIFLISIFFTFNTVCAIEADQPAKLDLKEAIELAQKNNIDVNVSKMNVDIATNNIKTANRLKNPSLYLFNNFGTAGKGNPQQVGLFQPIELGKRTARKNLAKSNLEFSKENYEFQCFETEMDVRQAYIGLVSAKSVLKIMEEQKQLLEELLKDLKRTNKQRDDEGELEIMQTEIALNLTIAKINTAAVDVENARLNFNKVLNLKDDSDINYDSKDNLLYEKTAFSFLLTPPLDEKIPEFEDIKNRTFDKRFDLKIKKNEIDIAQKELITVLKQRIPDLEIAGGYSYQTNSQSNGEGYLSGAYAGVGLTNIPLLYSYLPEIRNAKTNLEQAKLKYDAESNIASHQLKSTYEMFKKSKTNLNYYDENIMGKSFELLKVSKNSFKTGKSTLATFITIEQSHINVRQEYIEAMSEYYNNWIDFLRAVNCNDFVLNQESL